MVYRGRFGGVPLFGPLGAQNGGPPQKSPYFKEDAFPPSGTSLLLAEQLQKEVSGAQGVGGLAGIEPLTNGGNWLGGPPFVETLRR